MLAIGIALLVMSGVLFGYAHGYSKGEAVGYSKCSDPSNQNLPAWTIEKEPSI